MTEGTWNLYLPDYQKQARGEELLTYVKQRLLEGGAPILLVETSGLESFEYVRAFYPQSG